jgi:hypothetical protein
MHALFTSFSSLNLRLACDHIVQSVDKDPFWSFLVWVVVQHKLQMVHAHCIHSLSADLASAIVALATATTAWEERNSQILHQLQVHHCQQK